MDSMIFALSHLLEILNGANGMSDIEGKVTRVGASEWSRGDASDIDGQNREVEMGGST